MVIIMTMMMIMILIMVSRFAMLSCAGNHECTILWVAQQANAKCGTQGCAASTSRIACTPRRSFRLSPSFQSLNPPRSCLTVCVHFVPTQRPPDSLEYGSNIAEKYIAFFCPEHCSHVPQQLYCMPRIAGISFCKFIFSFVGAFESAPPQLTNFIFWTKVTKHIFQY